MSLIIQAGTHICDFSFLQLLKKKKCRIKHFDTKISDLSISSVLLPNSILLSLVQNKKVNKIGFCCFICREARPMLQFHMFPQGNQKFPP